MASNWKAINFNHAQALQWFTSCQDLMNSHGAKVWISNEDGKILRDALAHRFCAGVDQLSDSIGRSRNADTKSKDYPKDNGMLFEVIEEWSEIVKQRDRLTHHYHKTNVSIFKSSMTEHENFGVLLDSTRKLHALSVDKVVAEENL